MRWDEMREKVALGVINTQCVKLIMNESIKLELVNCIWNKMFEINNWKIREHIFIGYGLNGGFLLGLT